MEELMRSEVREIAREEVERTLTTRTIPDYPAYFVEGHWLVTYEWQQAAMTSLRYQINRLEVRVAELETSWWRRWLHR